MENNIYITPLCEDHFQEIDPFSSREIILSLNITLFVVDFAGGVIAKINLFFIIFTEISPYLEVEKVPLFRIINLLRECDPG
jgi:hypothetical protein